MIIDAHVHLPITSEERSYDEAKALLLEDLKRDQVDHAILIPDNGPSEIGDVPTCLGLAQGVAELFVMGTIDIETQGEDWIKNLETMARQRQIVGMKIFPGHDPIYPTDPRLAPVYGLCQASGMPIVIHTGWNSGHPEVAKFNDPKYIVQVAEQYPSMRIVIAHFFWPEVEYCFDVTHSYPNIYYDTSGLADEEVVAATGLDRIQSVLIKTLRSAPKRVVFGSDYAMCDRRDHVKMIEQLLLTEDVRQCVFWRNTADLFNLPL